MNTITLHCFKAIVVSLTTPPCLTKNICNIQAEQQKELKVEDKIVMLSLLLAEIVNSIIRDITALASQNCESRERAAMAEIVLFPIISVLFLVVVFPAFYIFIYKKENEWFENKGIHIILLLIQLIGASLFTYGDNINKIIGRYSEELCDECLENINISARMALGLSLTIFHALPHALHKLFQSMEISIEEEERAWHVLNMATTIIKIDSLYTVATTEVTGELCSDTHIVTSSVLFAIIFLYGIIVKVFDCKRSKVNLENLKDNKCIITASVITVICLFLYLLADNTQPIDCAFGCNFSTLTNYSFECNTSSNMTEIEGSCDITGNSILRLVFMIAVVVGLISVSLFPSVFPSPQNNNRIEPFVMEL